MRLFAMMSSVFACLCFQLWGPSLAAGSTISEIIGIPFEELGVLHFKHQKQTFSVHLDGVLLPGLGINLLDFHRLEKMADAMDSQIAVREQSAYIDEQGKIVEHMTGITLDRKELFRKIWEFCYQDAPHTAMLPVRLTAPRITTQLLKQSMEKKISGFATYYNPRNQNRSHNIYLATKSINHYVLLPGEVFSFNKAVGKRTVERGYKRAPVIVRGELSEGIGGGICQVSSTLFNAVDKAGLKILKRYSHSKRVGYVPPGRDATVSWYGPDFVFRNDYDHPIMIKCSAGNGVNAVEIYSSKGLDAELRNVPHAPKELPEETMNE